MDKETYKKIKSLISSQDDSSVFLGIELMKSLEGPLLYPFMQKLARKDIYLYKCMQEGLADGLRKLQIETLEVDGRELPPQEAQPLSSAIGLLPGLKRLQLNNLQLTSIPDEIEKLQNLEELELTNNNIKDVNVSLGKLKSLQELLLFNNPIEEIAVEILMVSSLQLIGLSATQLKKLPASIGQDNKVPVIMVDSTPINSIPEWFQRGRDNFTYNFENCKYLKYLPAAAFENKPWGVLYVNGCTALKDLPKNLFTNFSRREIDLRSSAVKSLPDEFLPWRSFHCQIDLNANISTLPQGMLDADLENHRGFFVIQLNNAQIPENQILHMLSKRHDDLQIFMD